MIRSPHPIDRTQFAATTWSELIDELRLKGPELLELLTQKGVLLLRGFEVKDLSRFQELAQAIDPEVGHYHGQTDRAQIQGKVYDSTPIPGPFDIPLHSETSYSNYFPGRGWFFCLTAAQQGGETLFADNRALIEQLPAAILSAFKQRGLRYVRNIPPSAHWVVRFSKRFRLGILKGWEEMSASGDRASLESFYGANQIPYRWQGDWLDLGATLPATRHHPKTGEEVWFNQASVFFITARVHSRLAAVLNRVLNFLCGRELVSCRYGDGELLKEDDILRIREQMKQNAFAISWQSGDIVLFDNYLVSHGRAPFKGKRELRTIFSAYGSGDTFSGTSL